MKAFVFTLFLFGAALTGSHVRASDSGKSPSSGDIDMNQFKNLEEPTDAEKMKDARIKVQMSCTDPQGHIIHKGEVGFDTCLSQTQSPIMNKPRTPEAPNDPRSY